MSHRQRELSEVEWEAQLEACFRLAVHPDTPFLESVELLKKCIRHDGSNPKFVYHLARVYFVHRKLEEASHWLTTACRLGPTSHRVWAHACLLHWELNESYRDPKRFEPDSLRKRGREIAEILRSGKEPTRAELASFTPKESLAEKERRERVGTSSRPTELQSHGPQNNSADGEWFHVQRILNPGVLRWTGVKDLVVENALRGQAGTRLVKQIAPLMQEIADDSRRRKGGLAAFAILAVEWLICGLPPATIRRLLADLELIETERELPSLQLLDSVCKIYETSDSELLGRLVELAATGRLPSLLGTIIHRRKALWKPLGFSGVATYRQGRRLLGTSRSTRCDERPENVEQMAVELAGRLEKMLGEFNPEPPATLEDWVPTSSRASTHSLEPAEAVAELSVLETLCKRLMELRKIATQLLPEVVMPGLQSSDSTDAFARGVADKAVIDAAFETIRQLSETTKAKLGEIAIVTQTAKRTELPANLAERIESIGRSLDDIAKPGAFAKKLRRAQRLVDGGNVIVTSEPSTPITTFLAEVEALVTPIHKGNTADTQSIDDALTQLEMMTKKLEEAKFSFVQTLRKKTLPAARSGSDDDRARAFADLDLVQSIVALFKEVEMAMTQGLGQLVKHLEGVAPEPAPSDFPARRDALHSKVTGLASLGTAKRAVKLVTSALANTVPPRDSTPADVTPELIAVHNRLSEVLSPLGIDLNKSLADTGDAVAESLPPGQDAVSKHIDAKLRPLERLSRVLKSIDGAVDTMFDVALSSFDDYPGWYRSALPMSDLMAAIRERQAELLFRLGRRIEARWIWSDLLCQDPNHISACKNIAVVDTRAAGAERPLSSWNLYVQRLYSTAVMAHDLSTHSDARARVHRSFARTYAVPAIAREMDSDWEKRLDSGEIVEFIANGRRVESFVNHTLLEFLNRHTTYRSFSLLLGVARDDPDEIRARGAESLRAFAAQACAALPEETCARVLTMIEERIEQSAEQSREVDEKRWLAPRADPHYAEEHDKHIALLRDVASLKRKLWEMVIKNRDFVTRMTSVDFIRAFVRLDQIPLAVSDQFSVPVAASLGMEPDVLQHLMARMGESLCAELLGFLFQETDDGTMQQRQRDQYARLVNNWLKGGAFSDMTSMVDRAANFFPENVQEKLQSLGETGITDEIIDLLRSYHERYPAFTGIARDLAQLLLNEDMKDEALRVLDRAAALGCHEDGRKTCRHFALQLRAQIAADAERYDEAVRHLEVIVEDDKHNSTFVIHLIVLTGNLISETGDLGKLDKLRDTVVRWIARARNYILSWTGDDEERICPVDEYRIADVEQQLDQTVTRSYLNCSIKSFNEGSSAASAGNTSRARALMAIAEERADYVIENASPDRDSAMIEETWKIKESIEKILNALP
jgi:tetratricopeptide (TPR) repeat protein